MGAAWAGRGQPGRDGRLGGQAVGRCDLGDVPSPPHCATASLGVLGHIPCLHQAQAGQPNPSAFGAELLPPHGADSRWVGARPSPLSLSQPPPPVPVPARSPRQRAGAVRARLRHCIAVLLRLRCLFFFAFFFLSLFFLFLLQFFSPPLCKLRQPLARGRAAGGAGGRGARPPEIHTAPPNPAGLPLPRTRCGSSSFLFIPAWFGVVPRHPPLLPVTPPPRSEGVKDIKKI